MGNSTPKVLFDAVRRRLRLQRLATALRRATWAAVAILVAMALLQLFVARFDVTVVLAATALPWLVGAGWTASGRITPAECAAWADRHLGGKSAYATLLETVGDQPPRPASPAVEALLQWVDAAVPRSQAMLHALPLRMRLAKPVMTLFVSGALTAILLQLPAPDTAAKWNMPAGAPVAQTEPDAHLATAPRDQPAAETTEPTVAVQSSRGQAREAPPTAELVAAKAGADSVEKELALSTDPATGASGSRAASGGREAGDSPDTLDDAGFTPSWQGELARKVLSSTAAADNVPARADPSHAADYAAAPSPPDDSSAVPLMSPAPAVPPEARPRVRLGPAEQAYVRAYFSGSGATP
jgi:hypothetical protein